MLRTQGCAVFDVKDENAVVNLRAIRALIVFPGTWHMVSLPGDFPLAGGRVLIGGFGFGAGR